MSEEGFQESGAAVREDDAGERTIREGLSKKDKGLPIGQNIVRVYGHTPELQWLGEAIACGDEAILKEAVRRSSGSIKQYYGLSLMFKPDSEVVKITKNPNNLATLKDNEILMSETLAQLPLGMAIELAHELGAARLIMIYGSKSNIPYGLPDPDEGSELFTATHYLDRYVQSAGTDSAIIELTRQFVGRNGLATRSS